MITGSCLCGKVKYEIHAPLGPITHCHCQTCRKAHATAFSSVAQVDADALTFTSGEALLNAFESSPGKRRYFCSNCGSQIYAKRDDQNHCILRMGTVDGDPGNRPAQHIFTRYKAPWYNIHDDIPEYFEWPPKTPVEDLSDPAKNERLLAALQLMFSHAVKRSTSSSLLLLEIDCDEEEVPEMVDQKIRSNVRNSDTIKMLSSSRYAVLLPYTNANASLIMAERILNTMRKEAQKEIFRIGAATLLPEQLNGDNMKQNSDKIIYMAERALGHAEKTGNRAAVHFDQLA